MDGSQLWWLIVPAQLITQQNDVCHTAEHWGVLENNQKSS